MSSEMTFPSTKALLNAREYAEKKKKERKIQIICLIKQYLESEGYVNSANCLSSEFPAARDYIVCDNIDLQTVLLEFESYYYARYERYPKLYKKFESGDSSTNTVGSKKIKPTYRAQSASKIHYVELNNDNIKTFAKEKTGNDSSLEMLDSNFSLSNVGKITNIGLTVSPLGPRSDNVQIDRDNSGSPNKSIGMLQDNSSNYLNFEQDITKAVMSEDPTVTWSDIIGHEDVKSILKEAILYPIKYPGLFRYVRSWNSLLLFGPPGTGKSLLTKVVAAEFPVKLINISPSLVISKWRGDSEKLIKEIFDFAVSKAPSTIVIEEIDALISKRDISMEHEASRRSKTELLIQMDRITHHNAFNKERVFVLATSNIPWDIDPAMIRRLEKRILVDLPTSPERKQLFESFLSRGAAESIDFFDLAQSSEGYSGSDINESCKESLMEKIREVIKRFENGKTGEGKCSSIQPMAVKTEDVKNALARNKPTSLKFSEKYNQWNNEFGSY